jgi:methyl-accepting chemotaxis protein
MMARIVLPVGVMLTVALSLLALLIQSKSSSTIQGVAERELAALAGEKGNDVKSLFEVPMEASQSMAQALKSTMEKDMIPPREQIIHMLRGLEESQDAFLASGCAWEPDAYDGKDAENIGKPGSGPTGRFIPYLGHGVPLEPMADMETSEYYIEPKKRMRPFLSSPYFYEVGGKKMLITTASAPVVIKNSFRGVVLIDLSLERIAKIVRELSIYSTGWGAVLTQDGTLVADKDFNKVGKSAFEVGYVGKSDALRAAMRDGRPFMEEHVVNGKNSFFYYFPLRFENTGQTWYFAVSAPMDEVLEAVAGISRLTVGVSLGTLLLALLLICLLVRSSVRPLGILADVAKKIAGGNLHVPINDEHFGGEVRELSTALKEMIASLIDNISKAEAMSKDARAQTAKAEEAMRGAEAAQAAERARRDSLLAAADQLEKVIAAISAASGKLSAQVEQCERGASEQASQVGETASAMTEMNSTVLEVARNASSASEVSAQTRSKAEEGAKIVQEAVTGIRNVQSVSLSLKDDMARLDKQADSISQIMSVISDIADQTNLLALNAAIEAARAGEAGRGFAVVADEVRKLAEKTMISTTDVGKAIHSIQQSVKQSIGQVDRVGELIDAATEKSNKSGDALGEIVTMVDNAADQVRAIATASEQQSATSEEINRSIEHINGIAAQTAQAMRESTQSVADLAAQTKTLSRLIEDMKKG